MYLVESSSTLTTLAIILCISTSVRGSDEPPGPGSENTAEKSKNKNTEDEDDWGDEMLVEKYAHSGDTCKHDMYKKHMESFNEHIANQKLGLAREVLDNVSLTLEGMPKESRTQFAQDICYGSALMCEKETSKCKCMKIEVDGRKFHFIAETDHHHHQKHTQICRADVGTFCQPAGFKCRADHICIDNVCALAENRGNNPHMSRATMTLFLLTSTARILAQLQ